MAKALLRPANFTLGPDAALNTVIHKNSVRIKAPNSVKVSKRNTTVDFSHTVGVLHGTVIWLKWTDTQTTEDSDKNNTSARGDIKKELIETAFLHFASVRTTSTNAK